MSARRDDLPAALSNPQNRTRDRLHYAEGRLLRAADLAEEQLYHRGRLAQALRLLHGCGTVAGLRISYAVEVASKTERLTVQAGIALDCFGRMIEIPQDYVLDLGRWYADQESTALRAAYRVAPPPFDDGAGVVADVLLRFASMPRGVTPAFATANADATDSFVSAHIRDGFELMLCLATGAALRKLPTGTGSGSSTAVSAEDIFAAWERLPRIPDSQATPAASAYAEPPSIDRDVSTLLLARLCFSVRDQERRVLKSDGMFEPPRIQQDIRRFVYAPGLLALVSGY